MKLSEEQKARVYDDLSNGSNPRGAFFLMVAISTLIAAFGLVSNSTAVVIGAMLVAPLMTPILGLSLGLVRGDALLIGIALRSETIGVVVAVLMGALFGLSLPYFEATSEMLSRTHPNLLDLLVAVFAGLAGAYALVDEKLSPALPGVAISTAIVPPLANTGLSLSVGAYEGARGSFLLFFTNFLSILLASALIFSVAGMGERLRLRSGLIIVGRFGVAVVGFALVAVLLGSELMRMLGNQRLTDQVRGALQAELHEMRASDIVRVIHEQRGGELLVLAELKAPNVMSPQKVEQIEKRLEEKVNRPVLLSLQITITKHVNSSRGFDKAFAETLDGIVVQGGANEPSDELQVAEQSIRETLGEKLGVYLEDLRVHPLDVGWVFIAELSGYRALERSEISEMKSRIQEKLGHPRVRLLIVQRPPFIGDEKGGLRSQFESPSVPTLKEQAVIDKIETLARAWLSEHGFWLDRWSQTTLDGVNHVLLEVKGPRMFSISDYEALERKFASDLGRQVILFVRSTPETVISGQGEVVFEELLEEYRNLNESTYPDATERLIEGVY